MATAVPPPHLPLFFFFFASTIVTTTASPPPAPAPAPPSLPSCTNELVSFSPCLSFVSSPPNNLDDAASASCCDAFSSAVSSGAAVCFCYLLREPPILGFPLNTTRLMSLSLVCPPANPTSPARAPSLDSLCSESSSSLPPLNKSDTLGLKSASTADSSNRVSPLAGIPLKGSDTGGGGGNNESGGNLTKDGGSKGGEGGGHNHNHSSESEGISSDYMSWLLRSTLFTFILPLVCHHL